MNELSLRRMLLISIQQALLREITPNIRGITCGWDEHQIIIKFYFDGNFTEEEREAMECIATEVIASIPDYGISVECQRLDAPESLATYKLIAWAYLRKE